MMVTLSTPNEIEACGIKAVAEDLLNGKVRVALRDENDEIDHVEIPNAGGMAEATALLIRRFDIVGYAKWVMDGERQAAWDAAHPEPPLIEPETLYDDYEAYCQ